MSTSATPRPERSGDRQAAAAPSEGSRPDDGARANPPASPEWMAIIRQWLGPALIAIAFVIMAIWSWGTWPDPMIDFGRELYTPWQLVQGKVLYRDVASFYGPLSPYVNALWFTIFGISLRTLALCNMAIMIGLIAMLHRLISGIADRF